MSVATAGGSAGCTAASHARRAVCCRCQAVSHPPRTRAATPAASVDRRIVVTSLLTGVTAVAASALLPALPARAEPADAAAWQQAKDLFASLSENQRQKLADADDAFAKSDSLKKLLEKSAANAAKNKREVANKYCYRQAELGIGDCGGLNLIPGMTKNGKQKTPKWMADMLGVKQEPEDENVMTLEKLLGPQKD